MHNTVYTTSFNIFSYFDYEYTYQKTHPVSETCPTFYKPWLVAYARTLNANPKKETKFITTCYGNITTESPPKKGI